MASARCTFCSFVQDWVWWALTLMLRRSKTRTKNPNNNNKCPSSGVFPMIWETSYYLLYTLRAAFITKCLLTWRKTKLEVIQALPGKLPAESPVAANHGVNGMSWIDVEQIDLACGRLGKQQEILQLCKAKSSSTSLCSRLMAMPDCTWKEFALPTGADQ